MKTPATQFLDARGVRYSEHFYEYVEHGGAGRKRIEPCAPREAERHTGYQVGGTSPFGTRKPMPVYMERSISALPAIFINGGRRGLLVRLGTQDLISALRPELVDVALED
jgi:Cys-tRNA(Pro) deacylase